MFRCCAKSRLEPTQYTEALVGRYLLHSKKQVPIFILGALRCFWSINIGLIIRVFLFLLFLQYKWYIGSLACNSKHALF